MCFIINKFFSFLSGSAEKKRETQWKRAIPEQWAEEGVLSGLGQGWGLAGNVLISGSYKFVTSFLLLKPGRGGCWQQQVGGGGVSSEQADFWVL
jgi:hypothetical protein